VTLSARAAARRVVGPRVYLRRGYRVTITPTRRELPIGGPVVAASVFGLRRAGHFRALMFESRVFILDQFIVGGHYVSELRRLRREIESRAGDGRVYIADCGANVGLFGLFSSLLLRPQVSGVGFEPFHENRLLCGENWRRHQRLVVRPEALADVDTSAAPLYVRTTTGATIVDAEVTEPVPHTEQASLARLDTLWPELDLPRVDLVKLDIEGAEESALTGAIETIGRQRPFVICSYEHRTNDPQRLIALFAGIGGYSHRDDPSRKLLTFEPLRPR
jgi:FkbM family methyltransferase